MKSEDQKGMVSKFTSKGRVPNLDGSHLTFHWDLLKNQFEGLVDIEVQNEQTLDQIRAWRGREQVYPLVFAQNIWEYFLKITCPVMALGSKGSVLWPYMAVVKELVRITLVQSFLKTSRASIPDTPYDSWFWRIKSN